MEIEVTEPEIIINGKKLTDAQATTMRVALRNFSQDLYINGLGEDDRGLTIKILYQTRIKEIIRIMAEALARQKKKREEKERFQSSDEGKIMEEMAAKLRIRLD